MRVFNLGTIRQCQIKHARAAIGLEAWLRITKRSVWADFDDIRGRFPHASYVRGPLRQVGERTFTEDRVVFNIGGNGFRLITRVDFNTQGVYVLFFGTHADYDRIDAATVEYGDG